MEKIYNIWLSSLDIKNSTKLRLLRNYSSKEIWNLDYSSLLENNCPDDDISQILNSKNLEESKNIYNYMHEHNIQIISIRDYSYPIKLNYIDDRPAFLYARGDISILDNNAVRNCRL